MILSHLSPINTLIVEQERHTKTPTMTRKKVKLVWIASDSARKASLKKRRVGLLKKVSELTTLCGVNAFVIIYSPEDNEPAVWPSRPVVQQLLARFQSLPEMERSKKMMNQETYLKERVGKVQEQLKKLHKKNKEVEMANLMYQIYHGKSLDELHITELHGLLWLVEERMKEARKRIDYFEQAPLPSQGPALGDDMGRIRGSGGDAKTPTEPVLWDQWFIDLINNSERVGGSSSVRGDVGLPHNTYAGSSSGANDMGQYHGTFRGHTGGSDMGQRHGNTGGTHSEFAVELGLHPQGNIGGGNSGNDIGLGLQPHGTIGGSTGGSEMGLPFGFFGGSSGGSDIGLPYDVTKTWPNNYSP